MLIPDKGTSEHSKFSTTIIFLPLTGLIPVSLLRITKHILYETTNTGTRVKRKKIRKTINLFF